MKQFTILWVICCLANNLLYSAYLNNSQYSQIQVKPTPEPEYYVTINSSNENSLSKNYPIYRVPDRFLIKKAIHIKTKNLVGFDKNYSRIHLGSISEILSKYQVDKINAPFLGTLNNELLDNNKIGIEKIFEVYFSEEIDPYEVCKQLMQSPDVEYATPIYVRQIFDFTPNDPNIASQWYINNIQLPKAWDITKGDKSVVIAIIDSGVDWKHPDLEANIWTNPKEIPNNGIDDDKNGKVDDIRGWDFVGNVSTQDLMNGIYREDNDPTNIQGFHGTHVAGLASAVTNNNLGIASAGFNCSIMPIKCSPDQGGMGIFRGYEGIVYAADLGAKVINCSWGGPGFSPAEQDIINYATEKGSLVVVASGNDGAYIDYGGQYPAGYDNLLCVGASNSSNLVANFSNWGIKVSTYAPGQSIYSTMPNSAYSTQNGTSMACPIVSGVAGLVASVHKEWSPKQILHQIRSTSDNILTSDQNLRPYYYGRVNAYKAVYYNSPSRPNIPGLEIVEYKFSQGTAITDFNPKVLQLKVKNFLGPASNVTLRLKPMYNFISLGQEEFNIGNITTLADKSINVSITLLENNPWYSGNVYILCTFLAGDYVDYQILSIPVRINSENKLTKVFTLPDAYKPTWFGAHSPQFDCLWAVGQGGMFGSYSGFVLIRSGTSSANYISSQPVYCICALSSTTAFAGSGSQNNTTAYIYKTVNAGQNWSSTNVSSITGFVNAIYFFDQNEGIFLGDPKNGNWGIGRTTDGGITWQPVLGIPLPNTNETGFVNSTAKWEDYLWFGTNVGRVFYSTNKGRNWSFANIPNATIISYITFRDSLHGMAIYRETTATNAPSYLATSTDGGKSWKSRQYNFTQNGYVPIYLFSPENSKMMYVLCAGGQIFGTSDLGNNWVSVLNEFTGQIETGADIVVQKTKVRLWQVGLSLSYLDFSLVPLTINKEIQLTSESKLFYDTVNIGSNKLKYISIKNIGNAPANISARIDTIDAFSDEFKFFGSVANSIAPGEEIQIRVRFVPKEEGVRNAKLVIESDAEPKIFYIELIGIGRRQVSDVAESGNVISLFPNPVKDKLFISGLINSTGISLFIYDVFGNLMDFIKINPNINGDDKFEIPIKDFSPGLYILRLELEDKTVFHKFIKI